MTTSPVRIISVRLEPPWSGDPSRKRYHITLSCGCSWWEDHADIDTPVVGGTATCFAQHSATAAVA